jgi:type IV pilus assembly protein PilA
MKSEPQTPAPGTQRQATLEAGFTLIELLIVMSIIIVIMALAVPQVLKMRINANQLSAVQTMRVIGSAEMQYASSYPTNGFACPLALLGGDSKAGAPSPQASQLIDPTLAATGIKAGYVFTVTCGAKTTLNNQDVYSSFELIGVPQSVGHSGNNGYCSDDTNIIKIDPTGGTNCTQPLQ